LILSEDHLLAKLRLATKKKEEMDWLDGDVFSKKSTQNRVVIGYGKKNPNIAKKKAGKKNKARSVM
jgi:hypothetical protein